MRKNDQSRKIEIGQEIGKLLILQCEIFGK